MRCKSPQGGDITVRCGGGIAPVLWADAANVRRRCERSEPSRYRLNREDFSEIPFPDIKSVQAKNVQEINARTSQARQLREAAEREWQEAKEIFEKALLGWASKRHCEEQWRNRYPTDIPPEEFRMNNR